MAHHEFSQRREIIEEIQQGKLKQLATPKPVAVGDTVELVSAPPLSVPPLLLPYETQDFPEENPIRARVVVSDVEPCPDLRFPCLIHWVAPASVS